MIVQKNKYLFIIVLLLSIKVHSQDTKMPWAFYFGVNAIDTKASAGGTNTWLNNRFSNFFDIEQSWNNSQGLPYFGLQRYVGNNFTVGLTGSLNKISKYVVFDPSNPIHNSRGYVVTNPGDLMYYSLDATIKYHMMQLTGTKWFDPSLSSGTGYTFLGNHSYGTFNLGLGATFWFSERMGFELASNYKKSFEKREIAGILNAPSYLQHTAGLIYKFGGKDTDGDTVYDFKDACPEQPGLIAFDGCPDTDGDGIIDSNDACPKASGLKANMGCPDRDNDGTIDDNDWCPNIAGPKELNGCPDSDNDGVADKEDLCPQVKGQTRNNGCPFIDSDEDGIEDKEDQCPQVKGPTENNGCPFIDSDEDGIADKDDQCPEVFGVFSKAGCPEGVPSEILERVEKQINLVYFDSGRAVFKGDAILRLKEISNSLKLYPNAKFRIEGYTDSEGSDLFNQELSQARADLIRNYLIKFGLNENNLIAVGFGENEPIDSNETINGKAANRRAVIVVIE